MMILKSLKRFFNDVIKKGFLAWRPAALWKRDSNTGSTVMILKSLKRFLNDGTKKFFNDGTEKFLNDRTKKVPYWWNQKGFLIMVQ